MNRILLRALNPLGLVFLAIFGMAVQGAFFAWYPLRYFQPEILLLLVIWLGLRRPFTEGGILTLILGYVAETQSASPRGVLMCVSMATLLMVRWADKALVLPRTGIGNSSDAPLSVRTFHGLGFTFIVVCLSKIVLSFILLGLGARAAQVLHVWFAMFSSAFFTAFAGHWIYTWLDTYDLITYRQTRNELIDPMSAPSRELTGEAPSTTVEDPEQDKVRKFDLNFNLLTPGRRFREWFEKLKHPELPD